MEGKVFTPGNQSWCQGGSHVVIHRIILHKSSSLAFASGVPVIFKPEVKSPPSATLIWTAALSAVCCNPLYSCEYDLLHFRRTIFPHTLNFILRLLLSQYENPWLWISTHRRPGSGSRSGSWSGCGSNAASQYSKRSLLARVLCKRRVTDELVVIKRSRKGRFFVNRADQIQEHSAYYYEHFYY